MNIWNKIQTMGITPDMPVYMQKGTMLFNTIVRFMMILAIVGILAMKYVLGFYLIPIMFSILFLVMLSGLLLTAKGKVFVAVYIVAGIVPWFGVLVSVLSKSYGEGMSVFVYIVPRFSILFGVVFPVIVIGYYNIRNALAAMIPGVIAFILYDYIHTLFDVPFSAMTFRPEHYPLMVGGIAITGAYFLFISFFLQHINQRYEAMVLTQKEEIEAQRDYAVEQNKQIEEQHHKITSSIQYAKRIQTAMLPPDDLNSTYIKESFILYRPRDIVSGDFYWKKEIGNAVYLAIADCTGHGVPGAFMSMLGITILNDMSARMTQMQCSDVLDTMREEIKKALRQTGKDNEAKDGMDIAFCRIDIPNMQLQFSGANNPLYLVREGELIHYKPDKMPVGIHRRETPFTSHDIAIQDADSLYMFSDGFIDQFGGPHGHKFKTSALKQLILSMQTTGMSEQKNIFADELTAWMNYTDTHGGTYSQVDDILLVGIKVSGTQTIT